MASVADFKKYDIVLSNNKTSKDKEGIVGKVSELGVHVKFWDSLHNKFFHQIFRIEKTHPLHCSIEELEKTGKVSH